ncbi:3-oxoacyl-ACP reductase FabG [Acidithiobacillus sp. CV18-2]|uniref:3-oxoacyl-[acyl-carrier-protein] reductase n=1 Tax=Igneacidithiobacillus copahuensis TaxID=2724909 RepID=A0AAE2YQ66_9PROT|nr:3-oxoacyl-ACP reductase FabG [Igneacidithiobacillus copahuensis]MBU2755679.1 3-oxoacyl-ACP reductase FabG [Acidithiobacillus sp. CV18-3]MBU2758249.1 3-oxoacyl-ACP reductase FabG [Acidithiobacillus sp. BN09-2]MBU2777507.1 3-oxoacyl-ACP reductase FabG [Acidithiobacillus sp. CV18-2]MBU2796821.1 3-oxoacyl-ACP reductase FabG [Acidithiobacillus sp. VAN18-2]MBU2800431.1 3-oxoacyl-ACP reductase FabG [Acidithiobacillus sp. VAN18-4]UTV80225.1 3-oxoacyl-ACP reductase FabG [Acidithiobacillus sp. YTS05
MSHALDGQVVLITGGSRGIGAALVEEFRSLGAQVAATATSAAGAEALCEKLGERGRGYVLDVTDDAAMDATLAQIRAELGAPSVLVNNAGITRDQLLLRMKDEDWDRVLQTNLRAVYRLSRLCVRDMIKAQFGRIISITSVVGMMGNAGQSNYAAAKAGVMGFSRALAREVAARGVTVNCVAPGFIATDMTAALNEAQREHLLQQIPAGRLGSGQDVAAAVAFLASAQASYITGETLQVNGGLWMG